MILSQKQIEEIAAAVTEDFNKFFFGTESEEVRMARATPIDQFARDYLSLKVSFARLSSDGSICGLTAYSERHWGIQCLKKLQEILKSVSCIGASDSYL